MWFDSLPENHRWSALWYGYSTCGSCRGIRNKDEACPCCGAALPTPPEGFPLTLMGAEGRYEDYVYLDMMEREWTRPLHPEEANLSLHGAASPRATLVLLFWTYFETRVERLLRMGMVGSLSRLTKDALERYSPVGARLDRLYRIVFDSTFAADLNSLGLVGVWSHLKEVQRRRNAFAHGDPRAIDDQLVEQVVQELKSEHEAWIAVFNLRVRVALESLARDIRD